MKFFVNFAKLSLLTLSIFIFGTIFSTSFAQTNEPTISITPKYPGPFQTVTATVEDFSRDLGRSSIAWYVNGKNVEEGIGLKQVQVKTGAMGSETNISVDIEGDIDELVVRPSEVDLIWQADSYTPPFYKGKSLHSNQDPITVVAEPYLTNSQGKKIDPDTLVYKWSNNGQINTAASGYGKKAFRINPSILLKPINVRVDVSSIDEAAQSSATASIPDSQTEVLLYENNPLYGIRFEQALNDKEFEVANPETNIIGLPFFFSNQQKNLNQLSYNWKLNNSVVEQQSDEITFRKPEDATSGQSLIKLNIKNNERFMQASETSFYAKFMGESETQNSSQTVF